MTLADQIVVMRAGKIEQVGSPDELYEDPQNLFVAGFIGSPRMNFLRASPANGSVRLEAGPTLTISGAPSTQDMVVGIRPEHFVFGGDGPQLTITADVIENLGGTRYLYGTTKSGEALIVEAREQTGITSGDQVSVGLRTERALFFESSGQRLKLSAAS